MAVYVDDMEADFGHMKMCHMMADSTQELLEMATAIGVAHQWIQSKGTYKEHFDIAKSKKKLAIEHGAIAVSQREMGRLLVARRKGELMNKPDTTFVIQILTSFGWQDVDGFRYTEHTEVFDVFERIKKAGVKRFDAHAKAVRYIRRDEIQADIIEAAAGGE